MTKAKAAPETETETEPAKRPPPPVSVGPTCRPRPQQNEAASLLEVMLLDLGLFNGRLTGHYGNELRNSVAQLQEILIDEGVLDYKRPTGEFDEATRQALLDSKIPTILATID